MQIRNLQLAKFHYLAFLAGFMALTTRAYAVDHSSFYKRAEKKQL